MSYIEKSIEDCIEDTEEYYEETEAIEAAEEVQKFQNPPKKAKKPRTQKQIDSLQKAREARAKNLASKKQEKMGAIKPPTKAAVKVEDVPQTITKAAPPKPKKKARRKIVIQQQEDHFLVRTVCSMVQGRPATLVLWSEEGSFIYQSFCHI